MEVFNNRKKLINFYIILLKSTIIFQIIILSFSETQTECDYDTPIRRKESNDCIIGDCTQQEYQEGDCSIENQKIKTQWLNNFILFDGGLDFIYIDIINSLNGKLIALIFTSDPDDPTRIFFGLKKNDGRGNFIVHETDTSFLTRFHSDLKLRDHPNAFTFKVNDGNMDNTEYLISISNNDVIEIYDIEHNFIHQPRIYELFNEHFNISSYINVLLPISNNNYALAFIVNDNNNNYFYLFKLQFTTYLIDDKAIFKNDTKYYESSDSKIVSCFQSDQNYIICFYQDRSFNYQEIIFDQNYEIKKNDTIVNGPLNEENYFEGVHFTGETAAFLYYNSENKPIIIFKKYNLNNNSIINYFDNIGHIELNINNSNTCVDFNDLIKISEFKICFTSINENKKDLYLTIINNYDQINEKIKIRYYIIHMFNLYIYEFNAGLSTTIYNNYIVLASSFSIIDNEEYESFSIILFSYPNSEDFTIDLNEIFIIDLNLKCKIENNIFGLVYNGIKLLNISEGYNLLSTKHGRELSIDDYIYEDEKIIVDLNNLASIPENGRIVFALEVKEPNYNIYNDYAYLIQNINGNDTEENYFEQKTYIGRHSYCNIIKINDDSLADECEAQNCKLCLSNQTCIYVKIILNYHKMEMQ